jgi:hypothetical protein
MSATLSASFALSHPSSSEASNFEEILAKRPDLIDVEDDEGVRLLFAILNQDAALRLAAETAALADKFGFVVVEENQSWSAIEPLPELWNSIPGAHRRWSAAIITDHEYGDQPIFEINSLDVTDPHQMASMQGYEGWRVNVRKENNTVQIVYMHTDQIAA